MNKQEMIEQYRLLLNRLHEENKEYIAYITFYKHIEAGRTIEDMVKIKPKQWWSNKWKKNPSSWLLSPETLEKARKDFNNWISLKTLTSKYNVSIAYFYSHWFRR